MGVGVSVDPLRGGAVRTYPKYHRRDGSRGREVGSPAIISTYKIVRFELYEIGMLMLYNNIRV